MYQSIKYILNMYINTDRPVINNVFIVTFAIYCKAHAQLLNMCLFLYICLNFCLVVVL